MGYQNGPALITVTQQLVAVVWVVDHDAKTVQVQVGGVTIGTWPNRTAAKQALNLRDVPAKGR